MRPRRSTPGAVTGRVPVTDDAIERIKEMIVTGRLGPGDRLPAEDELAGSLGLSRSSLREAVRALCLVRILDVRHGDGTYVTSLDPEVLLDALSFVSDFHKDDSVIHFLEVRRVLEGHATGMVARRATADQVTALRHILDRCSPELPTEVFVEIDREFHSTLNSFCGNRVMVSLLESVSAPTHRARVWRGMGDPQAVERTRREHEAIVDAIEAHEADVAAARALVHVAGLMDWLRRFQLVAVGEEGVLSPGGRHDRQPQARDRHGHAARRLPRPADLIVDGVGETATEQ